MEKEIAINKEIKDMIYIIRGQQVMLDSDLAELYGYEVKRLNEQVSRNISKFPADFMFELNHLEMLEVSKSQFATTIQIKGVKGGRTSKIRAFTEMGVYMLATILRGNTATQQTIFIIRSFKEMKHYIAENRQIISSTELSNINNRLDKHEADINKIMDNFIDETKIKEITFLEGQKFEANEAYINIYKKSKNTIYVIDNYVDFKTLSLLKHKQENVKVIIFTANKAKHKLSEFELDNFHNEYPSLTIMRTKGFHDRYIILDYGTSDEVMYHCGHSSKDSGNKISTIHKMLDADVLHPVIDCLLKGKDFIFKG